MEIQTIGAVCTMSTREIAELTGKLVKHVNRDAERMIDDLRASGEDGPDLDHVRIDRDARGYIVAIHLPQGLSITLVTGYSVVHRHRIVKRWQELEASVQKPAELSRMDILRLAMESEEGRLKAEAALALAAPKVEFVDRYVSAPTSSMGIREVVKLLKTNGHTVNEHSFTEWLVSSGYMYRKQSSRPDKTGKLTPAAQHEKAGRFETKTGHGANGHTVPVYKFTGKGVSWIVGEWAKHQIFEVAA